MKKLTMTQRITLNRLSEQFKIMWERNQVREEKTTGVKVKTLKVLQRVGLVELNESEFVIQARLTPLGVEQKSKPLLVDF